MAVVRCLILCSKFTKNRLSAGLRPAPLGELTALSKTPYLGHVGREGKGEVEGQEWQGK